MEYFEAEQDNIGLQSKRKAEAVRKKAESVQEFNRMVKTSLAYRTVIAPVAMDAPAGKDENMENVEKQETGIKKVIPPEVKAAALEAVAAGEAVSKVAARLGVDKSTIYYWRQAAEKEKSIKKAVPVPVATVREPANAPIVSVQPVQARQTKIDLDSLRRALDELDSYQQYGSRNAAFSMIHNEMAQNSRYKETNNYTHWASMLGAEYGELCHEVNRAIVNGWDKAKLAKKACRVAALAVAIMESTGQFCDVEK